MAPAQSLADLFESSKYSVVTIYTDEQVNTGTGDPRTFASSQGLGSGVLIGNNMILTAVPCCGQCRGDYG